MNKDLREQVKIMIGLLVQQSYWQIEQWTKGVRLPANQIENAIDGYGKTLCVPPEKAYELMDIIEIENSKHQKWSVNMPLWTLEEGRSDLTVELSIAKVDCDYYVELDDIHVL